MFGGAAQPVEQQIDRHHEEADAGDAGQAADEDRPFIDDEPEGPQSGDLFTSGPAHDAAFEEDSLVAPEDIEAEYRPADGLDRDRYIIDDQAPYDFVAPAVRPLPERSESGLFTLVALAVLGLIFFGGGIFWASYARPAAEAHLVSPRLVGGLAGIAGVGFFVVAVYLLLDRLGRASERQARNRP